MKKIFLFSIIIACLLTVKGFAATISGTITNGSTSAPVSGQTVYLMDSITSYWSYIDTTVTNSSGAYSFTVSGTISTGRMRIGAVTCGTVWNSAAYAYSGSSLTINLSVCNPITVSGTVYYSILGGSPSGLKVYLADTSTTAHTLIYRDSTFTNSTGGYSFTMPATTAQFGIAALGCGSRWSAGFYSYYGVNQTINLGMGCVPPYVYDTVRNSTSGAAVWGQKVYLVDSSATVYYLDSAITDITGVVRFTMPYATLAGTLRVYTMACGRQTQSFSYSAAATTIAPTLSICLSNAIVSGTVTNITTSAGVANHPVYLVDSSATAILYSDTTKFTNASGGYSFTIPLNITSGTMIAAVQACGARVANRSAFSGSNLTLNLAVCSSSTATISGTVMVYSTSTPLAGKKVYLTDTSFATSSVTYRDSTITNASGFYSFTIPPTITSAYLKVGATSCGGGISWSGYMAYSGSSLTRNIAVCASTALATVSGTITKGGGIPLPGATVLIAGGPSTTTNSSGTYTLSIPGNWSLGSGGSWNVSIGCGAGVIQKYLSFTYTGINITINDSLACPSYSLSGTVTKQGGGAAASAKVYLIGEFPDTTVTPHTVYLQALDSTITNSSGQYAFIRVNSGYWTLSQHIKAALQPSDPAYWNYLPTYHDSALLWSSANTLTGSAWAASAGNLNISLRGGTNPGGPGFIGGDVLLGANKSTGVGDPLSQRIILLTTSAGKAVGYAYSDAAGKFSFSNLPYGTYYLFGDAWGKTNLQLSITLSAAKPSVSNVKFEENSTTFKGSLNGLAVPNSVSTLAALYPNPAHDALRLVGVRGAVSVTLRNVMGVAVRQVTDTDGASVILHIADLPAGVYSAEVRTGAVIMRQVIVKE